MPKSFLIKKRSGPTQGPSRGNLTTGWQEKEPTGTSEFDHDVSPQSALSDDNEPVVEPLDLIVTRAREGGVRLQDTSDVSNHKNTTLERGTTHNSDSILLRSLQGINVVNGTRRILPKPAQRFSSVGNDLRLQHEVRRPLPERPLQSKRPLSGRPLPDRPLPDHEQRLKVPGYFSRCLLACKLNRNRAMSGQKCHYCHFCAKGFKDKFDLKRHIRTHTGVRPYKCDRCFRAFTQRCSLEVHQRKVHNIELNFAFKQRRGKVYVCEDCGHSTNDINQHYAHSLREHRAPVPHCEARAPGGEAFGAGPVNLAVPRVPQGVIEPHRPMTIRQADYALGLGSF